MINGVNELQFLYYDLHVALIIKIINIILGIVLSFYFYKYSKKLLGNIIGIYYGSLLGGMTAYIIHSHWIMIIVGAVIGIIASLLINIVFKNGYLSVVLFVAFMKITYLLYNLVVKIYKVFFYQEVDIYPEAVDEFYARSDIGILIAIIVGIILSIVFTKIKFNEKIHGLLFTFIGSTQLVGFLGSWPRNTFVWSGGGWENFFIPMLNIEYNENILYYLLMIVFISVLSWVYQLD